MRSRGLSERGSEGAKERESERMRIEGARE